MEASAKNKEKAERKKREKAEKEAKKAKNRAEREAAAAKKAAALSGVGADNYGNLPLIKSAKITDKVWTEIGSLNASKSGASVTIRGHLQLVRGMGKGCFAVVRSSLYTVQCVAFESSSVPKVMVEFITKVASESIVDVTGTITVPSSPVEKCTQKDVELQVTSFHVVVAAAPLPFQVSACAWDRERERQRTTCGASRKTPHEEVPLRSSLLLVANDTCLARSQMEDACRPDDGKETDVGAYTGEEEESKDGLPR